MRVSSGAPRESVKCLLVLPFGEGQLSREESICEVLADTTNAREGVQQQEEELGVGPS